MLKREGKAPHHDCTTHVPSPGDHYIGAIAECDECGRRWRLSRNGITFRHWRRTWGTKLHDVVTGARGICRWAPVQGYPSRPSWGRPRLQPPSTRPRRTDR